MVDVEFEFSANCIHIGSQKVEPKGDVQLTVKSIRLMLQNLTTNSIENIEISVSEPFDIVKCICHLETKLLLILYVQPSCRNLICEQLHIKPVENEIIIEAETSEAAVNTIRKLLRIRDEISLKEIEPIINKVKARCKEKKKEVNQDICLQYPAFGARQISITVNDYKCLACEEYLNDTIINFYIRFLSEEVLTDKQKAVTHIFDTFFYNMLTSTVRIKSVDERYARIVRWTKNIKIFDMDFLIVPINKSTHWFLAIICFPNLVGENDKSTSKHKKKRTENYDDVSSSEKVNKRPCILIFDSLSCGRSSVTAVLRDYLNLEYKQKVNGNSNIKFDSETMPAHSVNVPHQENTSDCGLFMLHYIEQFFKKPIKNFELPIKGLKDWFETSEGTRKRRDISELIKTQRNQMARDGNGNSCLMVQLPDIQLPP